MPTGKHFRNRFFQQKDILGLRLVMHIFIGFALAITFLYNALNWVIRKVDPVP